MRLAAAGLVAILAAGRAAAGPPETELGLENFFYPTATTLLNEGNVLGLREHEDLLRTTLNAKQTWGGARFVLRGFAQKRLGGGDSIDFTLRQGYAQYWRGSVFGVRLGKQRIAWGSGLAWNPTSRIEPPKNPLNTGLEQEGAWAARVDVVPNAKVGFIAVAARSDTRPGDLPFAAAGVKRAAGGARLRFLWRDTDVALVSSFGRDKPTLFGFDVGRGLGGQVAAHAEGAFSRGAELPPRRGEETFFRLAAGVLRTSGETALSAEYLFNGEGYDGNGFSDYRTRLETSFALSVNPLAPPAAREEARVAYLAAAALPYAGGLGLRRHYLQAAWTKSNIGQKWTTAMRAAVGLSDGGVALTPGLSYSPSGGVTVSVDGVVLLGPDRSEYRLSPVRGAVQSRVKWAF